MRLGWRRDALGIGCVATATLASRLPFLRPGYGTATDADLIVLAGRARSLSGHLVISRKPGYPLPELVATALWHVPAWGYNLATAVMSGVAVAFLCLVLRRFAVPLWPLVAMATALVPVLWAASTSSVDYVWAFTPAMAALWCAAERRPIAVGVCLGLVVASRLEFAVFVLPLLVAAPRGEFRRWAARLLAAATPIAVAAYMPQLIALGPSSFGYYPARVAAGTAMREATTLLWGPLGVLAIAVGAGVALIGRTWIADRRTAICLAGIVAPLIPFVRMPYQPAYLLPAVPFVLALIALSLPRVAARGVLVAVALSGLVGLGGPSLMAADHQHRISEAALVEQLHGKVAHLPAGSVVAISQALLPPLAASFPEALPDRQRCRTACPNTAWALPNGTRLIFAADDPRLAAVVR